MPKAPPRLFALMNYYEAGQAIVAQVLAYTKKDALGCFLQHYEFDEKDGRLIQELGGLDLPYVQEMELHVVRD